MRKALALTIIALLVLMFAFSATAAAAPKKNVHEANTITEGEVYYSSTHYLTGQAIPTGYDVYGYNYQAHMFNGSYANAYLGAAGFPPYTGDDEAYLAENPAAEGHWAWPYRNDKLMMQWNDAWLSNEDKNLDGVLDRHWGFSSFVGSGAWLTNKMTKYNCKIVAAPADAFSSGGFWYSVDGVEIGPVIWSEFAIIQENYPGYPEYKYVSPYSPGFGQY